MTRPTWSTKGRFIGLRVRNVGGTRERLARSGPISTFDTNIMILEKKTCAGAFIALYTGLFSNIMTLISHQRIPELHNIEIEVMSRAALTY